MYTTAQPQVEALYWKIYPWDTLLRIWTSFVRIRIQIRLFKSARPDPDPVSNPYPQKMLYKLFVTGIFLHVFLSIPKTIPHKKGKNVSNLSPKHLDPTTKVRIRLDPDPDPQHWWDIYG
jgi:hypothetical protein